MDAESVHKVAAVGAGTMGPGLALVCARAGHPVPPCCRTEETPPRSLAERVERTVRVAGEFTLETATPDEARTILGVTKNQ